MEIIDGFIPLIINLNVISICGYKDYEIANVGSGAIASGVLYMLAELTLAFSNYYCFEYKPLDETLPEEETNVTLSEEQTIKKLEEDTNLTQQLQELRSLKEQGLISEEDYESKEKQILGL